MDQEPRPRVIVVGLGPGDPALMSSAAATAIAGSDVARRWVRTARHPAAAVVTGARSFDDVYDVEPTFDAVYRRIVEELVAEAQHAAAAGGPGGGGPVLYAVPGSPSVAERTVELLRADARVAVETVLSPSFLDLAWDRLGIDPITAGVRVVDGRQFAEEAAGERGPLLVAQCDSRAVLSDVKLAAPDDLAPSTPVTVLQRLSLPDEHVTTVPWSDLDRSVEPDHLTSLWIPELAPPVGVEVARLAGLVRTLRERCPWDREQTHASLTKHLLEETYEVLDAIAAVDGPGGAGHLEEELGDLLFQIMFHANLAAEEGLFTLADVAREVHDKLVGRHPHVFGTVEARTPDAVMRNWEVIKQAEKGRASVMDGIPAALPALALAQKVQRKAASLGFGGPAADGDPGIAGGSAVDLDLDLGLGLGEGPGAELLAAAARLGRSGVDAEEALRSAAVAFRDRVRAAEVLAAERGIDLRAADTPTRATLWRDAGAD